MIDTGESMSTGRTILRRARILGLVWIDALAYAGAVAGVTTILAVVAGIATGGGLVRAKAILFLVGLGMMGYATFRLWPSSPEEFETNGGEGGVGGGAAVGVPDGINGIPEPDEPTKFQAFVRALPPVRWLPRPPPDRQFSAAAKLFLGSVGVLAVSYVMETVFGIV